MKEIVFQDKCETNVSDRRRGKLRYPIEEDDQVYTQVNTQVDTQVNTQVDTEVDTQIDTPNVKQRTRRKNNILNKIKVEKAKDSEESEIVEDEEEEEECIDSDALENDEESKKTIVDMEDSAEDENDVDDQEELEDEEEIEDQAPSVSDEKGEDVEPKKQKRLKKPNAKSKVKFKCKYCHYKSDWKYNRDRHQTTCKEQTPKDDGKDVQKWKKIIRRLKKEKAELEQENEKLRKSLRK